MGILIWLIFTEPNSATNWLGGEISIEHFQENDEEKLLVVIYRNGSYPPSENAPQEMSVPFGEYVLTKQ
jgi:hypothetical protein